MKDPPMMRHVNVFVVGSLASRKSWFESFHDISAFHYTSPLSPGKTHPARPAAHSRRHLDPQPAVTRQAPDFFTAQLVNGSCAYYFRHVFQDLLDVAGVTMTHIVATMERGYSKLLLFEFVLTPGDVPLYPGLLDLSGSAAQRDGAQRRTVGGAARPGGTGGGGVLGNGAGRGVVD
jgi:hypothetical protein